MSEGLFGLLEDLVRIPSVNPMGRDVSGDIYYERQNDFISGELVYQFGSRIST